MLVTYPPRSGQPPLHSHPHQAERFVILAGEMTVRQDGTVRTLHAGDVLDIPAGSEHAMWNSGNEPACVRWDTLPALNTEALHRTLAALAVRGQTTKRGVPHLWYAALLQRKFSNVLRMASPSWWVQRIIAGVLARIAMRLGIQLPFGNR
jgi:hypothetical protein